MTAGGLRRAANGLLLALMSALLGGCATRPAAIGEMPWTSGRLAVRVEATDASPVRSASAGFDLRGNADTGELRLLSPLGTLVAQTRWSATEVVLSTPDGTRRFDDLDSLSRETLGEALPLRALPDWLAGRPWGGAPSRVRDDGFEQLGWQVQVAQLSEGLLVARRDAPPAVTLRARIER